MRTIASTLMSLCLLAHALLGCCWHHQHECSSHEAIAQSDGCCEHHDCPVEDSGPCNCRIECRGVCVFLPAEKTLVDSWVAFDFVALDPTVVSDHAVNLLACEVAGGLADSAPPLRLHLLHQILVI